MFLILVVIVTIRKIPFRLVLHDKRPLVIEVHIRNNKPSERKYVVTIESGKDLSLSPSGLARFATERTGKVYPGESTTLFFKIYPRATTKPGTYEVKITVDECIDDYEHVEETRALSVKVPVI